jgi:hypothetical protein
MHREAWCALLSAQPDIVVSGSAGEVPVLIELQQTAKPTTILIDKPTPQPELARTVKETLAALFLIARRIADA